MQAESSHKYELIKVGKSKIHRSDQTRRFYQVKALRNIPEHNVKAGDLGGFVTHKKTLSQEGSCWISGEAQAVGSHIRIIEDAFIGDKVVLQTFSSSFRNFSPIVISGNAEISENATVTSSYTWIHAPDKCVITQNAKIYGNAYLDSAVEVKGASKIYGEAKIIKAYEIDNCEIYDNVVIYRECYVKNSSVFGNTVVQEEAKIRSSVICGDAVIYKSQIITEGTVIEGQQVLKEGYKEPDSTFVQIPSIESLLQLEAPAISGETGKTQNKELPPAGNAVSPGIMKAYREVCENIDSYRTDIVKIIKYPVMTDQRDAHTLDMMVALKTAQRLEEDDPKEFKEAVLTLEKVFMKAESNARRVASSLLSDSEKRKTEKAKDLFQVASDEASSEQEKKVAFIQGFKQLEGIIDVPDVAVDTLRIKIGLKELEG